MAHHSSGSLRGAGTMRCPHACARACALLACCGLLRQAQAQAQADAPPFVCTADAAAALAVRLLTQCPKDCSLIPAERGAWGYAPCAPSQPQYGLACQATGSCGALLDALGPTQRACIATHAAIPAEQLEAQLQAASQVCGGRGGASPCSEAHAGAWLGLLGACPKVRAREPRTARGRGAGGGEEGRGAPRVRPGEKKRESRCLWRARRLF